MSPANSREPSYKMYEIHQMNTPIWVVIEKQTSKERVSKATELLTVWRKQDWSRDELFAALFATELRAQHRGLVLWAGVTNQTINRSSLKWNGMLYTKCWVNYRLPPLVWTRRFQQSILGMIIMRSNGSIIHPLPSSSNKQNAFP